ncbi:hypothetical protein HXX76_007675 [Chlamydomonas incerta]|uniref:Uncharacterized protein n=1 Tax=Chlamydomonas incerta TaxID=51695 RepID=A0A835T9C8_CHLIN|nr:hypothetical protein HXX76_007675 [Chlamydomonas incerta]|eukprot:KAG2434790.1 hypothetical protein HXX76_007675 [Chlamydomonas incerta]
MATSSQLAKTAEASQQSARAAGDAVAELRHIHGIADKLLAGQATALEHSEALLAGQEELRREMGGVKAELAALRRMERTACLQRAREYAVKYGHTDRRLMDSILGNLIRGHTKLSLAGTLSSSDMHRLQGIVDELEGLTGLRFVLDKEYVLSEQQQ